MNLLAWSDSGEQAQFPVPKDGPYLVTGTGVASCLPGRPNGWRGDNCSRRDSGPGGSRSLASTLFLRQGLAYITGQHRSELFTVCREYSEMIAGHGLNLKFPSHVCPNRGGIVRQM